MSGRPADRRVAGVARSGGRRVAFARLVVLFLIAIVVAVTGAAVARLAARWALEGAYREVEIAMEAPALEQLAWRSGIPFDELVVRAKRAGLTALVVPEQTVADLEAAGQVALVPRVALAEGGAGGAAGTRVIAQSPELARRIRQSLPAGVLSQFAGERTLDVQAPPGALSPLRAGLGDRWLEVAARHGLRVVLRAAPDRLEGVVQQWTARGAGPIPSQAAPELSSIVADGRRAFGFPDAFEQSAELLQTFGVPVSLVEFGGQAGEDALAAALEYQVVRLHSILPEEMQRLSQNEAAARMVRAARERSVRLLYLRPPDPEATEVEPALQYVRSVAEGLREAGFLPGAAKAPGVGLGEVPLGLVLAVAGAAAAAGLLALLAWGSVSGQSGGLFTLGVWALVAGLAWALTAGVIWWRPTLGQQAAALEVALVFPVLAAGVAFRTASRQPTRQSSRQSSGQWVRPVGRALAGLGAAATVAAAGSALVAGVLSESSFMTGALRFAGVKLALLFPPVATAVLAWWAGRRGRADRAGLAGGAGQGPGQGAGQGFEEAGRAMWGALDGGWRAGVQRAMRALQRPVTLLQALAAVVLVAGSILYVGRSGNQLLPVNELELQLRRALEVALVARPRTKEFLVGHPALLLGLWLTLIAAPGKRTGWTALLLAAGTIGPVSIINTFAHLHSPLALSALRTFHGLWIGTALGLAAIAGVGWVSRALLPVGHSPDSSAGSPAPPTERPAAGPGVAQKVARP